MDNTIAALEELDIDPVFATKRPLHGRLGQVWRIQKLLPANPNSLDPEEQSVRFRLKPFYMDAEEDTKVMDRLDLTADQLKAWVDREINKNSVPVDQADIASNRKTSALARTFPAPRKKPPGFRWSRAGCRGFPPGFLVAYPP